VTMAGLGCGNRLDSCVAEFVRHNLMTYSLCYVMALCQVSHAVNRNESELHALEEG